MTEKASAKHKTCKLCRAYQHAKTPFMSSSGADDPRILVIGEAPGEEEDNQGVPFVGRSGKLLRDALDSVFGLDSVRFTNIVRCRPPKNVLDKANIEYCKQFALDEIDEYNPDIVLLMGNSPLKGVLNQTGISNWNGAVVKRDDRKYVPLYHPAFILRDGSKMDEWLEAMVSVDDDSPDDKGLAKIYPKTMDEFYAVLQKLHKAETVGFDIETNSLDAFNDTSKIMSVSFCEGTFAAAFPIDHPQSWWTKKERADVMEDMLDLLAKKSGHLIGHNIKFDLRYVYGVTGVQVESMSDSMLLSHIIDSRGGIHGLKRLAGIYLGMFNYDAELTAYKKAHKEADPERGGNYSNVPLEILLPYGALDAEATFRLEEMLYAKLSDKQQILFDELINPASNTLCRMECNGFKIDSYIANRYRIIYTTMKEKALDVVLQDKMVVKLTKARQKALDADFIDGDGRKHTRKHRTYVFNPNSPDQLRELYFQYYHIPVLAKSKKTGKPSISGKLYKNLRGEYPILEKVRFCALMNKALGTYIVPAAEGHWVSPRDGKARTNFNLHGTRTGRTSSSKPVNFQNIPTPEKEPGTILEYLPIKNVFTHSYQEEVVQNGDIKVVHNGRLVTADFSGMELRCFASLAHCMNMIRIIELGKDVHSCVAIMSMTHKLPDEITDKEIKALPKPVRYVYKWTNWTLLYGGDEHTLHRMYNVPIDDAKETVRMYYSIFPEVLDYKDQCVAFAEDNGYIESPFGRREQLPYINSDDINKRNKSIREAVNMPVQSGAGDTLLAAAVILESKMINAQMRSKLVNEVHDSIVGDCPFDEIRKFGRLAKDVMENVKTYMRTYMPHISMDWLIAPLKADVEYGTHYGTEEDLEL